MSEELVRRVPSPTATPSGHRFRHHELGLADGGRLVLRVNGTIDRLDALGSTTQSWTTEDPAWPDQAIRFGLHPQATTVAPQGRRSPGTKRPSW